MTEKMRIGLLGFGTVGQGVWELLQRNQTKIEKSAGREIEVASILVQDVEKYRNRGWKELPFTDNWEKICSDESLHAVVEVMGSPVEAERYIRESLEAGKHVVTANKEVIAQKGTELLEVARSRNKQLLFEASVAGGIPILRTLKDGLAGDEITGITGIVNGTTNFILTKMAKGNSSYAEALELAQSGGFAESDPTSDVEGWDSARKMAILSLTSFGFLPPVEEVAVSGIANILRSDYQVASQMGHTIKLIGQAKLEKDTFHIEVGPMLIPCQHPLAGIDDENNGIEVETRDAGTYFFVGPGAGSHPTGQCVISDLVEISRSIGQTRKREEDLFVTSVPPIAEVEPVRTLLIRTAQDSAALELALSKLGWNYELLASKAELKDQKSYILLKDVPQKEIRALQAKTMESLPEYEAVFPLLEK